MRLWKKIAIPVVTFATAMTFNTVAFADTELIDSVTVDVDCSISSGDDGSDAEDSVSASTDDDTYDVTSITVTNEPSGEWDDNDNPKLEIKLKADSGYAFYVDGEKISSDDVEIDGVSGSVTSVSVSSSNKRVLTIKFTMDDLDEQDYDDDDDEDYDLTVDNLEWNETTGEAYWDGADDANKYEVKLYRGGSLLVSETTTDTDYNFASYFTSSGRYQFRVRAVKNSSNKGDWESSDYFTVSTSEAEDIKNNYSSSSSSSATGPASESSSGGAWLKDDIGWWYCNADKSYTVNNWQYINGKWYFFNESGYMYTGWLLWNGYWYYLGPEGDMWYNATTPDGYYVNADGVWVS